MAALLQGDSACSHTAPWNATSMPTMEIGRIVGVARAWTGGSFIGRVVRSPHFSARRRTCPAVLRCIYVWMGGVGAT